MPKLLMFQEAAHWKAWNYALFFIQKAFLWITFMIFLSLIKPNQFTANIKVTEISRDVLIYSITVFLITSGRNSKRFNFTDWEIFITDFDVMTREESGSTTSCILLCSAGEKDDVTSSVTLTAAVMLYLLLRVNIKEKKLNIGKGSERNVK